MPDGKHLLASAFGSDGVAVFERNTQSGFINYTEIISRGVTIPWLAGARGVVAHPSGKAAYATGYTDDAVVTLRVGNPLPVLNTLAPASRVLNSGAFTLTVNGADFSPNSVVRINGSDRPTTFLNDTQLAAALTASDVSSVGSKVISVFTPAPGGGSSDLKSFVVAVAGALPIPSISQINTQGALAGSGPITVEVQGANFAANTVVLFNGAARPTTFVNSQLLRAHAERKRYRAARPRRDHRAEHHVAQRAASAPDATTQSGPLALTLVQPNLNPPPGITQISPASARSLEPITQVEVTVTGNGFLPESRVLWNDVEYPTQYLNGGTLKLIISAGDLALPGTASVKVFNPVPGGGESNVKTFTILDPLILFKIRLPLILR